MRALDQNRSTHHGGTGPRKAKAGREKGNYSNSVGSHDFELMRPTHEAGADGAFYYPAPKRRKSAAHGASRGTIEEGEKEAPEGRKKLATNNSKMVGIAETN